MASIEELNKAIGAHGTWKSLLMGAVETGKFETPVDVLQQDSQCAFGKWLYGPTLSAADKNSTHYQTVKELHAAFHKTAATVARLALAGKKTEANAMMNVGGEYASISQKLTMAMMEWKKVSK
jgi:hypothetical protein